jgi:DNA polymerase-3 subunit chi
MPHCRSHEADAAALPVVIGRDETFPHSELLISLHNTCLPFFSRFERVIEIVGMDDEDAKQGRDRYKFYKDRGYELRHFDLRKS